MTNPRDLVAQLLRTSRFAMRRSEAIRFIQARREMPAALPQARPDAPEPMPPVLLDRLADRAPEAPQSPTPHESAGPKPAVS